MKDQYGHADFIAQTARIIGNVDYVNPSYAKEMVVKAVDEFGPKILDLLRPELKEAVKHEQENPS